MTISGKQLHYRKNNQNYDIALYDSTQNTGSPSLNVYTGGQILHAKMGATNDVKASQLQVQHRGATKAILTKAEIILPCGTWSVLQNQHNTVVSADSITAVAYIGAFDRYWIGDVLFANPKLINAKLCFRVKKYNTSDIKVGFANALGGGIDKFIANEESYSVDKYIEVPLDTGYNYIVFGGGGFRGGAIDHYDKIYFTDVKIIG